MSPSYDQQQIIFCLSMFANISDSSTIISQGNRMLIEFSNSEELGLKFDGQLRL
jgi:hypothetical protein